MTKIEKIHITYEEGSDHNSPPVAKIKGIALGRKERIVAEKVNELIEHHNSEHNE